MRQDSVRIVFLGLIPIWTFYFGNFHKLSREEMIKQSKESVWFLWRWLFTYIYEYKYNGDKC